MHRRMPRLSSEARAALEAYPFPGNVRELENILERALAMADDDEISTADLRLPNVPNAQAAAVAAVFTGSNDPNARDPRHMDPRETGSSALPSYIEEIERAAIQQALQESRYNKTKAAAKLGITFRALRYKLKKLGID